MGGTVPQWNGPPFFLPNRLLVGSGKYCSWEPGRPRQAGALAVVTVAELLRSGDANSIERKEGSCVGGEAVFIGSAKGFLALGFFVWRMDGRFRSLVG